MHSFEFPNKLLPSLNFEVSQCPLQSYHKSYLHMPLDLFPRGAWLKEFLSLSPSPGFPCPQPHTISFHLIKHHHRKQGHSGDTFHIPSRAKHTSGPDPSNIEWTSYIHVLSSRLVVTNPSLSSPVTYIYIFKDKII